MTPVSNNHNSLKIEIPLENKAETPSLPRIQVVVQQSPSLSESRLAEHKNEERSSPKMGMEVEHFDFVSTLDCSRKLVATTPLSNPPTPPIAINRVASATPAESNALLAPKTSIGRRLSWRGSKDAAKRDHQKSMERQREVRFL